MTTLKQKMDVADAITKIERQAMRVQYETEHEAGETILKHIETLRAMLFDPPGPLSNSGE